MPSLPRKAGTSATVSAVHLKTRRWLKRAGSHDRSPTELQEDPSLRVLRWWMVLTAGLSIAGATAAATLWLLRLANTPELRIEAIRVGLTVGAGTGGAAALLLATRRQWLQERDHIRQHLADHAIQGDAIERRITELYTTAAEHLGSDKAPVRLAGLYALERLAAGHAEHRQTIVNVICAYLRMPYTRPTESAGNESDDGVDSSEAKDDAQRREELEVRLTAQRILASHLYHPGDEAESPTASTNGVEFWADIDVDLTGAVLIDFFFAALPPSVWSFQSGPVLR